MALAPQGAESIRQLRLARRASRQRVKEQMETTKQRRHAPTHRVPLHTRFNQAGVGILFVGLIGAALVYLFAGNDGNADTDSDMTVNKLYVFQMERIGGKAAVVGAELNQWFDSIWHGRELAYTLGALAIAAALACFWIANRLSVVSNSGHNQSKDNDS
jgi:hypothetical protein